MKGAQTELAEGESILPIADRGASEAQYDRQGAVVLDADAQPSKSARSILSDKFFEIGLYLAELEDHQTVETMCRFFDLYELGDLAHQMRAARRVVEKRLIDSMLEFDSREKVLGYTDTALRFDPVTPPMAEDDNIWCPVTKCQMRSAMKQAMDEARAHGLPAAEYHEDNAPAGAAQKWQEMARSGFIRLTDKYSGAK